MRKKCNKWCKNAPQKPHKCVNTPISGKKRGKNEGATPGITRRSPICHW